MTNRFEQSAPPSIDDIYRGLPIGPAGVEPFIFRDRGRYPRAARHLPWKHIFLAGKSVGRYLAQGWRGLGTIAHILTQRSFSGLNRATLPLSEKVCRHDARSSLPHGTI